MGLFSSDEDKIRKIDKQLSDVNKELLYKKTLKSMYDNTESNSELTSLDAALILHHDLQEIKEELKKMNQK
ncbi:hypothetical protein [Limosilactobacillus vaginalis]|uniref:Uncharacterized protein n=1 Tax=Limosilactobacillus vaginalis DSM 5837 = ATCC 49540 TaxID=1423814 RepID=C2EWB4_9LACO|nr:hypothetical protein [Limosilactobacillus vaginalis]EEJ39800.1 hypothetical protein HMPREF0549_1750 [Limosilactobacillus vaginalis DSM 5837 = ATCC 49540]QFS34359.1 hypothetical protein LV515_05470 [Limosilactobacillus vaginalis]